ncbi:MAG: 3-methyl-2-oxobutanoate dehydrogenase subunit VorB [Lachnospiraceae bacterium]|nr:3-methyl-2-oxobutanoate dehydrogenase subunit VorB [Lachnospiraceae bacterium]
MSKLFMKGNEAIAEAAVRGGCRFFAGYPITPQNEIPEYLSKRLPETGGVFVQAESELAAINMVVGAAFGGTRAMTSSSGPGLSLKSEGISTLAAAGFPAVIINMMRGGPGTGSIQGAQMDYLQMTRGGGHGGYRLPVFAPASVQEAVDLVYQAFDKAWEYKTPCLVIADGFIGAVMEPVELPPMKEVAREEFPVYTTPFIDPENPKRRACATMIVNEADHEKWNIVQAEKYERMKVNEVRVEEYQLEDAEYVIAAYGTSARIAKTAIKLLRAKGIKVGLIRPITVWPYPYESFRKLDSKQVKGVLCLELSIPAQMVEDVELGLQGRIPVRTHGRAAGMTFTAEDVCDLIEEMASDGQGR